MNDLAAIMLDITSNSINANASYIEITIIDNVKLDEFQLIIKDNGCGMSEETKQKALNPFYSTRKTRTIGMGLPLLYDLANQCQGKLSIQSKVNESTKISLKVLKSHIDLPPLGNIGEAMMILIQGNNKVDFQLNIQKNNEIYQLDTKVLKETLKTSSLNEFIILDWIMKDINQHI